MAEEHIYDRYTKAMANVNQALKMARESFQEWERLTFGLRKEGWLLKFDGMKHRPTLAQEAQGIQEIDLSEAPTLEELSRRATQYHKAVEASHAIWNSMSADQQQTINNPPPKL